MADSKQFSPPPPYGFNSPREPAQVIITQVTQVAALGTESVRTVCPTCHATVSTRVDKEASIKTHAFAFVLCIFGCWPCCLIPYCCSSCQATNHYCPNCNTFLGTYN